MSAIKYRAACDHCASTKIKCTQERPQCARCRALGKDCHYSRSLRAGKPPRSSQGLNRKISNAPVLPRHNTPMSNPTSTSKPELWPSMPTPYPTPPAVAPAAEMFYFQDLSSAATSSSSSPAGGDWFFDFNDGLRNGLGDLTIPFERNDSQISGVDHEGKSPAFTPHDLNAAFEDLINFAPTTPLLPNINHSDSDRCTKACAKLATDTLNSLYDMPTAQLDHTTSDHHPSVDQTLTTCARAVQALHEIVTCTCRKDFCLPMLVTLTASKLIAWYQAVTYIQDPGTDLPGQQCAKEVVVEGPMNLGAYQLDDKVGWTLKNQIVLGQLQRLGEAVGLYERRYCSDSLGGSMTEGGRLYGNLVGFVKGRLQFTVQELEGRGTDGCGR